MELYNYDKRFRDAGSGVLCGVDEAGRGPLAGPVFAAAVILPEGLVLEGLNDSKKLNEARRDALYDRIIASAKAYSIASSDVTEIDAHNILGASLFAMRRAVAALNTTPDCALVDGNRDPVLGIETVLIVKGDAKSASVAAASILAKVARDRYMLELDKQYPQYGFAKHKGYPTALHYAALDTHGPCPEHRPLFLRKWQAEREVQSIVKT